MAERRHERSGDNLIAPTRAHGQAQRVATLEPGYALSVPYKAPHRVEVDRGSSASLSITWTSRADRNRDAAAPRTHFNHFTGGSLERRDCASRYWKAALAGLAAASPLGACLFIENAPADDPATRAFLASRSRAGRSVRIERRRERVEWPPASHAARANGARRRRAASLRREAEREVGTMAVEELHGAAAMDDLLRLGDAGWEGRAGSSIIRCARRTRFVRDADVGAESRDAPRIARLTAGGHVLAMTSWFRIGDEAFGFKAAYCERHCRYAPGRLLLD